MVCLGNILLSNSTCSPSSPWTSLYRGEFLNHDNLLSHSMFDRGSSYIFPTHNTESENTDTSCIHELDDLLAVCQVQLLPCRITAALF